MSYIWERQPYETNAGYELFLAYLEQESPRSLLVAYNKVRAKRGQKGAQKVPGSFRELSFGKRRSGKDVEGGIPFTVRAIAFDNHVHSVELEKWQARRMEIKEQEWAAADGMMEKVNQMLLFPIMRQVAEDGVTVIEPAGWALRDIPVLAQTASKLGRLAVGMETESIKLDWRQEAEKQGLRPDELFNEVVELLKTKLVQSDVSGGDSPGPGGGGGGGES